MKINFFVCMIILTFLTSCSYLREEEEAYAEGMQTFDEWKKDLIVFGMTDTVHLYRGDLLDKKATRLCGSNNYTSKRTHTIKKIMKGTIAIHYEIFCKDIYKQKQLEKQKKENINAQKKENENLKRINLTCQKFGFKINTPEISKCTFDIYKLELSKTTNMLTSSGNANRTITSNAILEEQKRQNDLENNLQLLQRSLDLLNPTKPKLTCKYNSIFKNTTCY